MIRRYDEVMLEKANKLAVKDLYEHVTANYVKIKGYEEIRQE